MAIRIVVGQDTPQKQERRQMKHAKRQAENQLDEALTALTDEWEGATQGQRLQAIRQGVIVALRILRYMVRNA